jgi:hypothetical protein
MTASSTSVKILCNCIEFSLPKLYRASTGYLLYSQSWACLNNYLLSGMRHTQEHMYTSRTQCTCIVLARSPCTIWLTPLYSMSSLARTPCSTWTYTSYIHSDMLLPCCRHISHGPNSVQQQSHTCIN